MAMAWPTRAVVHLRQATQGSGAAMRISTGVGGGSVNRQRAASDRWMRRSPRKPEFDEPTPGVTLILPHKRRQYLPNGEEHQRIRFSNTPCPASGQWGSGNVLPSLPHCSALQLAASDNGTASCPREVDRRILNRGRLDKSGRRVADAGWWRETLDNDDDKRESRQTFMIRTFMKGVFQLKHRQPPPTGQTKHAGNGS
ncbi:predicted protein [Chaetomium globosum CBS 148.51]|uniref:Uncharacterized protein n=1 Tax=Chaetomium globosum (strain ATCC 6205 / CBS 148.51 / DSM 1962 / NBRC 6347 / NRRL 1970) TaxID=306901 RepID=Q2GTM0_CHAGB|nr:uncharacterized protein CHGG_08684 [Chaetomium globosum CBS 148.51]EAQ84670.1 predicted protein [Chaetomium globosum CBS 148.51]